MDRKRIVLDIPVKKPRNPLHEALARTKPGSHGKTAKAERRAQRVLVERMARNARGDGEPSPLAV